MRAMYPSLTSSSKRLQCRTFATTMSSKPLSPIRKAWYRWKSLKLPWRKRYLVGLDLHGNTFWEFRDALNAQRMRRIVQFPASSQYSDTSVSPQWHQWLRHTRYDPPTLTEQSQDVIRQDRLKVLVEQADARWAAKPSFLDAPERAQPTPALESRGMDGSSGDDDTGSSSFGSSSDRGAHMKTGADVQTPPADSKRYRGLRDPVMNVNPKEKKKEDDPWRQARGGPSEGWQPKPWESKVSEKGR